MIPLRDDVPVRRASIVVGALLVANVAIFLHQVSLAVRDAGEVVRFIETWGLVPRELLRGLGEPGSTRQVAWLTPFTSMFLHAGLLHLAGNMLYLRIFGRSVEQVLGAARFLGLYVACGLAAAAVQVASAPSSYAPMIGASGAVSGVLGAYLVSYPTRRLRLLWPRIQVPAALFLLLWIAIQVASGLESWGEMSGEVAWWAHVGGFAAGGVLGRSMWVRKPTSSRERI